MKKELTTVIMVMVDGKVKPLEDLTEEEHSRMLAAMAHRPRPSTSRRSRSAEKAQHHF